MTELFEKRTFKQWIKDNTVGIYITVIFHLSVFLVLSVNEIRVKSHARFITVDFEYQTIDKDGKTEEELLAEKEALEQELNELLKHMAHPSVNLPNIVVNQTGQGNETGTASNASLRDMSVIADKSAAKQEQMMQEKIHEENIDNRGPDEVPMPSRASSQTQGDEYKGPSILSYYLEGRYGVNLPVPAYKCLGGGDVVVIIDVNRQGYVTAAEIDRKRSSGGECVREAAMQAALISRFSQNQSAPASQKGNIIYRFIPQAK